MWEGFYATITCLSSQFDLSSPEVMAFLVQFRYPPLCFYSNSERPVWRCGPTINLIYFKRGGKDHNQKSMSFSANFMLARDCMIGSQFSHLFGLGGKVLRLKEAKKLILRQLFQRELDLGSLARWNIAGTEGMRKTRLQDISLASCLGAGLAKVIMKSIVYLSANKKRWRYRK